MWELNLKWQIILLVVCHGGQSVSLLVEAEMVATYSEVTFSFSQKQYSRLDDSQNALSVFTCTMSAAEQKVCGFDRWLMCVWSRLFPFYSTSKARWWAVLLRGGGDAEDVCCQAVLLGWSCLSIDIQICPENTNPYVRDQGLAWFQHNHFTVYAPLINKGAELYFISLF